VTDRYRCANCGGVFLIGRPDDEAQAEAVRDFGRDGRAPDMVVICDPCYKQMRERAGDAWGNDDDRSAR
jgi:hypothetical protein